MFSFALPMLQLDSVGKPGQLDRKRASPNGACIRAGDQGTAGPGARSGLMLTVPELQGAMLVTPVTSRGVVSSGGVPCSVVHRTARLAADRHVRPGDDELGCRSMRELEQLRAGRPPSIPTPGTPTVGNGLLAASSF
jgi:hypothetical protein